MTPDEMSEQLRLWEDGLIPVGSWQDGRNRRVDYIEYEGPRRTWLLWEDGRQVGHVRLRHRQPRGGEKRGWCSLCHRDVVLTVDWPWGFMPRTGCTECDAWFGPHVVNPDERVGNEPPVWAVETSDRTRTMLQLDGNE